MKKINVAVLDYGIGNVKSIINALENIGVNAILTSDKVVVNDSDALILPGVGAFNQGMQNLIKYNLVSVIHDFVEAGKPFMGICLGMQMLLEESEEFGYTKGLGLIKGKVIKMPLTKEANEKLPHVGWNELHEPNLGKWNKTILNGIPPQSDVYFVHTFVASPQISENILATAEYGESNFCAAVHRDNIYGVQFHPEKSGKIGLEIMHNFVGLVNNKI